MSGEPVITTPDKPLKAYTNILRLRLNRLFKRAVIDNYPIFAYIEPTLYCNLRCPACPTGLQLHLRPAATIDLEQYRAVLEEVGDYLFELHVYNWGEPLLFSETPEMIRLASAKGISVRLSSNLSMTLSDEYIEALVLSGLDTLVVSLDGASAQTYQHYRRRGDFERVCENMRRIQMAKVRLKQRRPIVICQFLVFRHNEHEIKNIRSIYRSLGADQLVVEGAQMPMETYRADFEPSTYPEYNIYHADHPYRREARRQMKRGQACSWLYGGLVLNPNGKVSPCCASPAESDDFGDYDAGQGLQGVWNNARFQAARRLFAASAEKAETAPIDGMGVQAHTLLKRGELICQHCPIPFRQDEADRTVARVGRRLLLNIWKPRSALALLLMGGMNTFILRRMAQAVTHRQHRRST